MDILLLRSWITNIGNGFIDRGAEEIIREAFPESNLISISGYNKQVQYRRQSASIEDLIHSRDTVDTNNIFSISSAVEPDIAVLPGCTLYKTAFENYYSTLLELSKRDIPIILLGAGSGDYSEESQEYLRDRLSNLNITGFISRNPKAYELYSENFQYTYNGIDCAFFINDWFSPCSFKDSVTVSTFDIVSEPDIRSPSTIVRPHHSPFDNPFIGLPKRAVHKYTPVDVAGSPYGSKLEKENSFISDSLEDYLMIYGNADRVHADRIHACIPGLMYGAKVRFYYDTERDGVFQNLVSGDINNELVSLKQDLTKRAKTDQVDQFRKFVQNSI